MRILHTADLHLGQILYQNYERIDEHDCFFDQLEEWVEQYRPDALIVSGDVFDIQQPSASVWKYFTERFVRIRRKLPEMKIVIIAGNHDSASRIQSHDAIWTLADARLVGLPPQLRVDEKDDWQENYIVRLKSGYIVALPYMTGERRETIQSILDRIGQENSDRLPVVMMSHLAVAGSDVTGHDFDIGRLRALDVGALGSGYDYLALGHIHKPQTIGHPEDCMKKDVCYASPVARYSGSALHVSCDEAYPHSVSLVDIDGREGDVRIRQLRIDELRHFHDLPSSSESYHSDEEALNGLKSYAEAGGSGYFRFRIDGKVSLASDFNQKVYAVIDSLEGRLRYNPKIVWTGLDESGVKTDPVKFEVAEIQQMTDPLQFIEKTSDRYPELKMDELREAFREIEEEVRNMLEK